MLQQLTARALGADRLLIRQGFFGFNGFYAGLRIAIYLGSDPLSWLYIVLGGASATILTMGVARALEPWELPPLTRPSSWCCGWPCSRARAT